MNIEQILIKDKVNYNKITKSNNNFYIIQHELFENTFKGLNPNYDSLLENSAKQFFKKYSERNLNEHSFELLIDLRNNLFFSDLDTSEKFELDFLRSNY